MNYLDAIMLVFIIVAVIGVALYFVNRWASRKMSDQQSMIERTKQPATIYVIDKKKMKASDSNLPKAVITQLPKIYKYMKVYLVKVKIGPQITTLMCEKKVFEALPLKKNVKVELAGIYIVSLKSSKNEQDNKADKGAKKTIGKSAWNNAVDRAKAIFKK